MFALQGVSLLSSTAPETLALSCFELPPSFKLHHVLFRKVLSQALSGPFLLVTVSIWDQALSQGG
jgi:hypothetical protein